MDAVKVDADRFSKATLAGGLLAGLAASACCLGPLLLFRTSPRFFVRRQAMNERSLFTALLLAAAALAPQASRAEQKTVVLAVPGMNCAACPITVRKALEKVAGVENAKARLEPPEAVVVFDDTKTSIEKLTEATKRAGFASSVKPGR